MGFASLLSIFTITMVIFSNHAVAATLEVSPSLQASSLDDLSIPHDGLFQVSYANKTYTLEMLTRHDPNNTIVTAPTQRRSPERYPPPHWPPIPITKKECYPSRRFTSSDYVVSLQMLQDRCTYGEDYGGTYVNRDTILGYKFNTALVYFCNYRSIRSLCVLKEMNDDMLFLDDYCPSVVDAGYAHHHHIKKTYGRDNPRLNKVCKNIGIDFGN